MAQMTTEHTVMIGDHVCKVYVGQQGMKTVWYASGQICGQYVQVQARSKGAALSNWIADAKDKCVTSWPPPAAGK
jgi:hypothetical protein